MTVDTVDCSERNVAPADTDDLSFLTWFYIIIMIMI